MIALGQTVEEKGALVRAAGMAKVVVVGQSLPLDGADQVSHEQIQQYRHFYRLLQSIDKSTLVVVNEALQSPDRNCLNYNCVRHYLAQAGQVLVFQYLPIIEQRADFLALYDFDTQSRWKRAGADAVDLREARITGRRVPVRFVAQEVVAPAKLRATYEQEKRRLFEELGAADPHTIPRRLHLLAGKVRWLEAVPMVGRNSRLPVAAVYGADPYPRGPYTLLDFPHAFGHMAHFLAGTGQTEVPARITDLRVDQWYFARYEAWAKALADTYDWLGI